MRGRCPRRFAPHSTVVGELTGTGSLVLVVDPAEFASMAWLEGVPGGQDSLRTLDAPTGATMPAIRVGHTSTQSLELPGLPVARPLVDLPAFPVIGSRPGYVISRDALTAEQLESVPRWSILSASALEELSAALADAGVLQINPMSRATRSTLCPSPSSSGASPTSPCSARRWASSPRWPCSSLSRYADGRTPSRARWCCGWGCDHVHSWAATCLSWVPLPGWPCWSASCAGPRSPGPRCPGSIRRAGSTAGTPRSHAAGTRGVRRRGPRRGAGGLARDALGAADEPTSQLEEQSADLVLDTLRGLARRDVALVITSHDERLIELGTRVVRLHAGRVDEITGEGT